MPSKAPILRRLLSPALLAGALVLALSCGGGSKLLPPGGSRGSGILLVEESDVRLRISLIEQALNAENLRLLADQMSPQVVIGSSVRARFRTSGSSDAKPLDFFRDVFRDNANLQVTIEPVSITIQGSVALAEVRFVSAATYIRDLPPVTTLSNTTDQMVFAVEGDRLLLTVWKEKPVPTAD